MFKYEMNEYVEITDILNHRSNNIMILSGIINACISEQEINLKPVDVFYINELLQNEVKLCVKI